MQMKEQNPEKQNIIV